ncbi:MAG: ribosome maturation factor RimP [Propionibacteriaceae bacterium]|nr:ribosome maturation factor RimP [Propionibacteriaceae bacterium]
MASVNDVVAAALSDLGIDLEDLTHTKAGSRVVVRITIDGDGANGHGLTLDEVAQASSEISRALDDSNAMGETPYVLEVGTRGVDAPLTRPAHWRRNIGRLVTVSRAGQEPITARIEAIDNEEVRLAGEGQVPFSSITKAIVQVEMNREDDTEEE